MNLKSVLPRITEAWLSVLTMLGTQGGSQDCEQSFIDATTPPGNLDFALMRDASCEESQK